MSFNRTTLTVIGFMAVAGYFLWTEHSAHVALALPYLPWLLLLACPFLHFFMHGSHGHGEHSGKKEKPANDVSELLEDAQVTKDGGRHD